MAYKLTHEEKAFFEAYNLCMGTAPNYEIEYFLEYKEKIQLVANSLEEQKISDDAIYWSHIEDAWLLWREAMEYARKPLLKTYKVIATYSAQSEVYIEAESVEQAQEMAQECGDFDGTIDPDAWEIQHIEEVTK